MKIGDEKIIFYFPERALSDVLEDVPRTNFLGHAHRLSFFNNMPIKQDKLFKKLVARQACILELANIS